MTSVALAATSLPVVYALGNHDTRAGFYEGMLGRSTDIDAPYDHEQVIAGVHIITLDTSTPGQIGGTIEPERFTEPDFHFTSMGALADAVEASLVA